MRKLVFIKESTVLIIFVAFLVLIPLSMELYGYYSSNTKVQYDKNQREVNRKIDSLTIIQNRISIYDSLNLTIQKIEPFSRTMDSVTALVQHDTTSNENSTLTNLINQRDSLISSKDRLEIQIEIYENKWDSISPTYSLQTRIAISDEKDMLQKVKLISINRNLKFIKQNISFYNLISYLIYIIPTILYPIRWVLLLLFKHTNLFGDQV